MTVVALSLAPLSVADVVIFDGFGDADINNNGIPLEDVDTDVAGAGPMGLPNTYVPARLEDINGDGPANNEVTSVLDASDTGIRWLQTRGFTGGSTVAAGTGLSKPTMRIVDDTQGAMQETMASGLNIPAIDSGYAMSWESRGGGSIAAGFFDQTISLGSEVGDEVKVSFDFRFWRDASNANAEVEPEAGELRFGLFQDTDNQLGQANPFAGRQVEDEFGFLTDTPAIWGQEEGMFEGSLTGNRGAGDDIGANGDNGWTASVFAGDPVVENGGGSRIREEIQADRQLQGSDVHTIAAPENINPDPFGLPEYDFHTLDNDKVYNLSLSLVRATDTDPGDTITSTLTIVDVATEESYSLTGTASLEDSTSGGVPIPGTGGIQSDSWDYFAIRSATSGSSEFDFLMDNFAIEVNGSNAGLAGDYNNDGTVDAADYTVWRDGLGTTFVQADYDVWANNYGASLPSQSTSASIPEPFAASLLVIGLSGLAMCRRRNA